MTNGNKQQTIFSNPLVLLLAGIGVALIAVVLAVMLLQPDGQLKTATYPSSSTTSAPAKDQCECRCYEMVGSGEIGPTLCAEKWSDNACKDYNYEYPSITDSRNCEAKNDQACRGYDVHNDNIRGELKFCQIVSSPSASASPSP